MIGTKLRACYPTVNGLMAWRVIVEYDDLQLWSDGLEYHRQKINTSVFLSKCCPAVNSLTSMMSYIYGLMDWSIISMMSYVYGLIDWSSIISMMSYVYGLIDWSSIIVRRITREFF
ncbi:hypothetical protein HELRODRAFT_176651 [Helobdella robusta]|uniref:Uncharacterized protein n=1 Tax=Helobdella robusta TaxID=6412 RepID=T1FAR6_HELRO|nr:hypothetical protein HELRODRAFT_176651 [Helobdella robusta]ESN99881.1 hypothetical protein HELRODRAFT_176651 [Helobdella robusta]